jgi:hypothetical protein
MITLHDVEALSDLAARLRSGASQPPSIIASVSEAAAIREQSIKEDELVFVWTIRQLVTLQLFLAANI